MTMNKDAKSYLAKLLATENISVEHKKVQTAYFDVKSRLRSEERRVGKEGRSRWET